MSQDKDTSGYKFEVRHTYFKTDPLGAPVTMDNAFFIGLTVHKSGKLPSELEIGESCVRECCTGDKYYFQTGQRGQKIHTYHVTRVE